jgi:hypothetical protein
MTMTLLDRPAPRASTTPAERLRITTAAVRVAFTWFGVRKTLTPEQKSQAADTFGAEGEYLSARKKLLDTKHPAYKGVTAVRGKILSYWKGNTLPYPEPGIRLIRQEEVEEFSRRLVDFQSMLHGAVAKLDNHYAELQAAARQRLGRLHNPNDYPPSLQGLFEVDCELPSVEPPDYLLQLSPALYEQERARVASRFDQAVGLAEQAFLSELGALIAHLTERLSDCGNGDKKIFRDSAIGNLTEFFERFRRLNVRSNEDLDDLVQQAQGIVQGVEPKDLRDNANLRQHIVTQMSQVQATIDGMIVDLPRRRIVRANPSANGACHANGD